MNSWKQSLPGKESQNKKAARMRGLFVCFIPAQEKAF